MTVMDRFSTGAVLAAALFILGLVPALGQPVVVDYAEGAVDARDGSQWSPVYIGQSLPAETGLRLGPDGYAELSRGSATVRLTRPGTYSLSSVLAGSQRNSRVGLGSMIRTRLERLGGEAPPAEDPGVAGVRGDDAGAEGLMWVGGEDVVELIENGIALLSEGDYDGARSRFGEAYDFAETDAQAARARFYLGYTAYLEGNVREAVQTFDSVSLEPADSDYDTWVLTRAQALVETFAYKDAVAVLGPYLEQGERLAAERQTALVLRAVARDGLERGDAARADLRAARRLDPSSEQGRMAARLLDEL